MKILWLCNIVPVMLAEKIGMEKPFDGGWISSGLKAMKEQGELEIAVCFPQTISRKVLVGQTEGIQYYGFPPTKCPEEQYDRKLEDTLKNIISDYQPDIVHIWGTEYAHSLAMAKKWAQPERTICSIQGVCAAIAENYRAGIPKKVVYGYTLRDLCRLDNVRRREKSFLRRARLEKETLSLVQHVIGRTEFDKESSRKVNPKAQYHYCSETLRDSFYIKENSWQYEKCEKHTIFVSSSYYPLKGFHRVLKAMPNVLQSYPDAKVYVVGNDPRKLPFYRMSKYYQYVKNLINRLKLGEKVIYLGWLSEKDMCEQFLKANVFVSASSMENSSNSIGEAMLLGMPVVASCVGGTKDILSDKKEGYLYPSDNVSLMAKYICKVFEMKESAKDLGNKAYERATKLYDRQHNVECLKQIYENVYEEVKG